MRIGFIVPSSLFPGSIDLGEYATQLAELGHEPMLICVGRSEIQANCPIHVTTRARLSDPQFYSDLQLHAAILLSWLHGDDMTRALKAANVYVILRGDVDGQISVRLFPRSSLRSSVAIESGWLTAAKCLKHWITRYLSLHRQEVSDSLACIDHADSTVIETEEARRNLCRVLTAYGRADLVAKVRVVPHFVSEDCFHAVLPSEKRKQVIAVGRWMSTQKNAPLLAETIDRYLTSDPTPTFLVVGAGGEKVFEKLLAKWPQVSYRGFVSHDQMRFLLADCRIFLSAARYESYPIAALEALVMGCSVVAPEMPGYLEMCNRGECGTLSKRYTASHLAQALALEMNAWDQGRRDPRRIAAQWRPGLSSHEVVRDLLAPVSADSQVRTGRELVNSRS